MIAHVSMPADDCEHVAKTLATLIGGAALRFPPGGPSAWNCWSKREDYQIVVTPRGNVIVPGPKEQAWVSRPVRAADDRASESHFALSVELSASEITSLAKAAGWQARLCNRGGMFDVVEVWVENCYLLELLDPSQMADYERSMTLANWQRAFAGAR